jgi:hypothetical protein
VLNGEATHINIIVFGLTRPGFEPTNHQTRGVYVEHSFISNADRGPLKKKSRWGSHSQINCNHLYMYFVNEESVADSNYVEIKYLVRHNLYSYDRTSGLLVSVLTSCLVVRGFEPRSGQTKDYIIDISCFCRRYLHGFSF